MRRPVESENKEARILSESGPLRTELGGTRYALPSPEFTWSPARAGQQRLAGAQEPGVPMCMPLLTEAKPAAARTNAPKPCSGRCVLMALAGFTVCASVENFSVPTGRGFEVERTVKSLYRIVKPLRQ